MTDSREFVRQLLECARPLALWRFDFSDGLFVATEFGSGVTTSQGKAAEDVEDCRTPRRWRETVITLGAYLARSIRSARKVPAG